MIMSTTYSEYYLVFTGAYINSYISWFDRNPQIGPMDNLSRIAFRIIYLLS